MESPAEKSIFPYSLYSTVEELYAAKEFPKYEDFYSSLKKVSEVALVIRYDSNQTFHITCIIWFISHDLYHMFRKTSQKRIIWLLEWNFIGENHFQKLIQGTWTIWQTGYVITMNWMYTPWFKQWNFRSQNSMNFSMLIPHYHLHYQVLHSSKWHVSSQVII